MYFYHGTTKKRATKIFKDGCIKCDVERHYTKEKSGNGYTEQGYIYLALEPTFSIYFANHCNLQDKSDGLVLFRINLNENEVEPDYDEMRVQPMYDFVREKYKDDLDYSMNELKSCRYGNDIPLTDNVSFVLIVEDEDTIYQLIKGAGFNLKTAIESYNKMQKDYLNNLDWQPCK